MTENASETYEGEDPSTMADADTAAEIAERAAEEIEQEVAE